MGKVVVFTAPRRVGFESDEDRPLNPHEVRLRTLYSGISAGTELTAYRGSNPYLHKLWDPTRKLFVPAEQPSLLAYQRQVMHERWVHKAWTTVCSSRVRSTRNRPDAARVLNHGRGANASSALTAYSGLAGDRVSPAGR